MEGEVKLTTENEKDLSENFVSRQIVQEVLNFGVSQNQIKQVIHLLAMELESRSHMLTIIEAVEKCDSDSIDNNKSGIITNE
jgi:hypothetical protein